MTACRLDRGCGEDPCVCQPPAKPYPKSAQLARGERRYRRKVASPKQWQAIIAAKMGPCRLCVQPASNGGYTSGPRPIEFHHLISRAQGGDDIEDNMVPLCALDHGYVTGRDPAALRALAESLTDAEYAYVVAKLGEAGPERLFGVGRG